MRGLTRRWIQRPTPARVRDDQPLLDRLLAARGLCDPDDIARFCDPRLTQLHPPEALPDADRAAARLLDALKSGEQIVIYGDYDVDGMTATAILFHTLRTIAPDADVRTYVPHRLDEGYGLNAQAIQTLAEGGASVIVSVDCGVTAHEPAAVARQAGADLIITDHHKPEPGADGTVELPQAFAIVHPALPGSDYPFAELCGAGVAYKLAWRIAVLHCGSQRVSESLQACLLHMLPLAALGTIADVVPLVDENRVLATYGLRTIKQTPIPGLRALINASDLASAKISSEDVGFKLAPRLNACGRLGHARDAVHLLTTATPDEGAELAKQLSSVNRKRQDMQRKIFTQASELAQDMGMTRDDRRIIVLAHEDWHPGVIGIVCSRLVEEYGRPAVLLQNQGDVCAGSARSIDGYSIVEGLRSCQDLMTRCGGHDMAAGMSLEAANFNAFVERLTEHANDGIASDELIPAVHFDCDATLNELNHNAVTRLQALGPFGRSNPKPSVRVSDVRLAAPPKQIGANGRHLAVQVKGERGPWMRCLWWNAGSRAADLASGMSLDMVIEPKLNEFNGRVSVEAEIRDLRPVPVAVESMACVER